MSFTPKDRDMQRAAVEALAEYDHCFISAEGVRHFTSPFGFEGSHYVARSNRSADNPKGLQLEEGVTELDGADAADVAEEICRKLGVKYPPMFGRGSRLRACCGALLEHLKQG